MKRAGFTLIETLIFISILALLFSISLPAFSRFSAQISLNASAKFLVSELRALQSKSVLQHTTLNVDLENLKLPSGINPVKTSNICFSPSGCPPPGGSGTLILQNRFGRQKKIIISSSGRVRIE